MDLYHLASCKAGWEKLEILVAEHEVAGKVESVQKWITYPEPRQARGRRKREEVLHWDPI